MSTYLKQTVLIGNIIISVLVAMSIIIVGLFELFPAITSQNQPTQFAIFKIVFNYALFAFMINLLREIIKDIEDIAGDTKAEIKTLPVVIGKKHATILVFILSMIPLIAVTYYVITILYKQQIAVVYFLVFIIAPLLYFTIKSITAKSNLELHQLSNILKLVMLLGILSLLLYPYMLNNA